MITKDLLESVASRANVLSNRYYFMEKEDLMQEGYILLLELEKKDLTPMQKHKAVNNMFSNLERHALHRQKIEKNSSSFEFEPDTPQIAEAIDEVLEREEITQQLLSRLSSKERMLVDWLSQGATLEEISTNLGLSKDRVQRLVNGIIAKREEIERCDL